jgi:hypothetical protein
VDQVSGCAATLNELSFISRGTSAEPPQVSSGVCWLEVLRISIDSSRLTAGATVKAPPTAWPRVWTPRQVCNACKMLSLVSMLLLKSHSQNPTSLPTRPAAARRIISLHYISHSALP